MMNEKKMEMLLRIAENPEMFDDNEIEQFLDDEECREYYELTVMAEEGFRRRKSEEKMLPRQEITPCVYTSPWRKAAVAAVGIAMVAGVTLAAIRLTTGGSEKSKVEKQQAEREMLNAVDPGNDASKEIKVLSAKPHVFENEDLEQVLSEMCAFYDFSVEFKNDEVRKLRLFFKWDKNSSAEEVVEELNHFESVDIVIKNHTFIVE
ncbi:DUF4974 domain-containing protein [Prevotella sp. OH937_COT-195]|uniref:DUF4974 domain-containing protein n=1 Tax=Prevotella sp. OH937_COT-195 TaxID=2491051 RepID=UPI000F6508A2|nr:DUF4974 domain-containing protein [Prevotella sp. OH937_COT-195]RRD02918.1 hypothetical protein EII32_00200 [Prevotella sp. OH937_COT-195]